jgi:putative endonuclease
MNYFVYILTNKHKTVLYIGITNNLTRRLAEHTEDSVGVKKHFAGKYNCIFLVYWERIVNVNHAIDREKELKGWKRIKKEELISNFNPDWNFLNNQIEE